MSADLLRLAADRLDAHIAAMSPTVGKALAVWLRVIADGTGLGLTYHADEKHALAVARAILGGTR